MQAVINTASARPRRARKPLRKLPKTGLPEHRDEAPSVEPVKLQQAANEPPGRAPGDWPPNTWWP